MRTMFKAALGAMALLCCGAAALAYARARNPQSERVPLQGSSVVQTQTANPAGWGGGSETQTTAGGAGGNTQVQSGAPVMTTSWNSSNGMSHTVVTDRKPNENAENQAQRHKLAVSALAAQFPPTGPPPPPPTGGLASQFLTWWPAALDTHASPVLALVRTPHEPGMWQHGTDTATVYANQAALHTDAVMALQFELPIATGQ